MTDAYITFAEYIADHIQNTLEYTENNNFYNLNGSQQFNSQGPQGYAGTSGPMGTSGSYGTSGSMGCSGVSGETYNQKNKLPILLEDFEIINQHKKVDRFSSSLSNNSNLHSLYE